MCIRDRIKGVFTKHQRIIYNGNNYSREWVEEAQRRGLAFLRTTPEALSHFLDQKNIDLFTKHGIYSETEMKSRYIILLEDYSKKRRIEAHTMLDMAKKDIVPAVVRYSNDLATAIHNKRALNLGLATTLEEEILTAVSEHATQLYKGITVLQEKINDAEKITDTQEQADFFADTVTVAMLLLRSTVDELELLVDAEYWPFPRYEKLLYSLD